MEPINNLLEFLKNIIGEGYAMTEKNYFRLKHDTYIYDSEKDIQYVKFSLNFEEFISINPFVNVPFYKINYENLIMFYGEPIKEDDIEIILI